MRRSFFITIFAVVFLAHIPAQGQTCETLLNLTFDPWTGAGNIAGHPDIDNVLTWTNGSESGNIFIPNPTALDSGNGYAGLDADPGTFSYKWGFDGGFDVLGTIPWDICTISFDYDVLGHNGEASLALSVGSWTGLAPLPSTGDEDAGPVFSPVAVGERATGVVTFDFATGLLTVTRDGYSDYTVALADSPSLAPGTQLIDILVSNTALGSSELFDANFNATAGANAFYRIDNFIITAAAVPEPSTAGLLVLAGGFLALRRRR